MLQEIASKNPGGSMWVEKWSHVRRQSRFLMGMASMCDVDPSFRLWRPDATHIVAIVGRLGLQLRLREGAGAVTRRLCKRNN